MWEEVRGGGGRCGRAATRWSLRILYVPRSFHARLPFDLENSHDIGHLRALPRILKTPNFAYYRWSGGSGKLPNRRTTALGGPLDLAMLGVFGFGAGLCWEFPVCVDLTAL